MFQAIPKTMTVTGSSSPLFLFQSKVEDALSLVSEMLTEDKLKAVQYWNVVSGKLQEIVNSSSADIHALVTDENGEKMTIANEKGSSVVMNGVYSNDYVIGTSSYPMGAEPNSQYLTDELNSQNGHYLSPGGPFTTVCYPEANPHPDSSNCYLSSRPVNAIEPSPSCIKSCHSSHEKFTYTPIAVEPDNDGLIDLSLPSDAASKSNMSVKSSDNRKCLVPSVKSVKKNSTLKQKCSNKPKKNRRDASQLLRLLTTAKKNESLEDVCSLEDMDEKNMHFQESSNIDISVESTCSSLSDSFAEGDKRISSDYNHEGTKVEESLPDSKDDTKVARNDQCWPHAKPFRCSECDACFSSKGNLRVHFRRHTGEKPYKCVTCSSVFTTRGNLLRHIKIHTGIKPYECMQCGSRFTENKSLKVHIRRHTGERPYVCSFCGKSFTQTGILQAHLAVHRNERSHLCEHCGKAFRQKCQLRIHKLRHQGVKNYVCSSCPASFLIKGDLLRHRRTHTGEKPYVCNVCKRRFTRQQTLNEHLNRHYGQKPFECKHCGKQFAEMSACYKHAKLHEKLPKETDEPTMCLESLPQSDPASTPLQISVSENFSQVIARSRHRNEVKPGEKFTLIFKDASKDIEVHSEFTVENEQTVSLISAINLENTERTRGAES